MLGEAAALYAAALAANLLTALMAFQNAVGKAAQRPIDTPRRLPRVASAAFILLALLLAWRSAVPFWYALRIGLYDLNDALLSLAAAVVLLTLVIVLRAKSLDAR